MFIGTYKIPGWDELTDREFDSQKAILKPFFKDRVRLRKGGETEKYVDALITEVSGYGGIDLGRGHVTYRILPLARALSGGGKCNELDAALVRSASMRIEYSLRGFDLPLYDHREFANATLHPVISAAIAQIQKENEYWMIRSGNGAIGTENSRLLYCPVGRLLAAQCKCETIGWYDEAAGFGALARATVRGIWPMGYISGVEAPEEKALQDASADEDKLFFLVGDGDVR